MRPVTYLSKHLDTVTSGWPDCLCIITTSVLFIKDADKSTLRQLRNITTPHSIEEVLKILPNQWIAHTRLTHYQALLLNLPCVMFLLTTSLNPETSDLIWIWTSYITAQSYTTAHHTQLQKIHEIPPELSGIKPPPRTTERIMHGPRKTMLLLP